MVHRAFVTAAVCDQNKIAAGAQWSLAFVAMLSSELLSQAMLGRMQYLLREQLVDIIVQWGADIKELLKLMDLPCDCPACGVEMTACGLYHGNAPSSF